MNNFIFQNATKVYFGKGCVKEYLSCLTGAARTVMLAYGGGSIKRNGIYDEVTKILRDAGKTIVEFPGIMANPTYAKVQAGAKLAREAGVDMILGVGGGSVMDCCKAISLAALHPVYYRHICKDGLSKFVRFAENVWGIERGGRSDEALAEAGIDALASFIREIGLPTTLRELGVTDQAQLKEIAASCAISAGSYRKMTHEEIYTIFMEGF